MKSTTVTISSDSNMFNVGDTIYIYPECNKVMRIVSVTSSTLTIRPLNWYEKTICYLNYLIRKIKSIFKRIYEYLPNRNISIL
jgi:hypothetical protein